MARCFFDKNSVDSIRIWSTGIFTAVFAWQPGILSTFGVSLIKPMPHNCQSLLEKIGVSATSPSCQQVQVLRASIAQDLCRFGLPFWRSITPEWCDLKCFTGYAVVVTCRRKQHQHNTKFWRVPFLARDFAVKIADFRVASNFPYSCSWLVNTWGISWGKMANTKFRSPVRAEKSKKTRWMTMVWRVKIHREKISLRTSKHSRDSFSKMKKQCIILFFVFTSSATINVSGS